MAPPPRTSAAGVLSLLSESDPVVQEHALKSLNTLVPQFWAEISEFIAPIEELFESAKFHKNAKELAALVLSKVFYYLGQYDEGLSFALRAGKAFQAETSREGAEEYVETIVSKAIDKYIELKRLEEDGIVSEKMDSRLQHIIEDIFTRCIADGEHRQALGIALESARLDIVTRIFELTKDTQLLSYVIDRVLDSGFKLAYRDKVLHHVIPLFPAPTAQSPHIYSLTRLHVTLSSPSLTLSFLTSLISDSSTQAAEQHLLAYQIAFDLVEGGTQDYIETIRLGLPDGDRDSQKEAYTKLRQILSGEETIRLYLDFLIRNNHTDELILKNSKEALDGRSSIYHTALTLQNAFMHCGTASDVFLRENLDWLGRASNWGKFSVTASLGVINKGNTWEAMKLLGPYLPNATGENGSGPYSEGGALYALGLINSGRGKDVIGYLREKLKEATSEVVQHGAALGLGVAGMAGGNADAYEDLRSTLFTDSAIAGEASGYAMGLVMLGTGSERCVDEMLQYARETQHEKIIRGLAMGVAFIYYGRQEEADNVIAKLLADKDSILRYGGVYTLALAYAGTADNGAVKKLLHIAVSDTSDDVRRAAVTSLAFLLFKNPNQVPRLVQLLSESYNPHVRCGATLALGLACAGTGSQDAIGLLEPMTKDPVDFVRQGALIALSMILLQQTEAGSPSVAPTRASFAKITVDKHEDPMARFGAAVAQGFIDAGGRNITISLQSRAGSKNMSAIIGMALFCQFWYWYPLALCASLAFEPTAIIGLTETLQTPAFEFVSNAKPSLFAYPSPTKPPTKEVVQRVETAVLSTTAKAKQREKEKEKAKAAEEGVAMDEDEKPPVKSEEKKDDDVAMKLDDAESSPSTSKPAEGDAATIANGSTSTTKPAASRKRESSSEKLPNLSRVTPAQLVHISFPSECRFQPVRAVSVLVSASNQGSSTSKKTPQRYANGGGILMLVDKTPNEPIEWIAPKHSVGSVEVQQDGVGAMPPGGDLMAWSAEEAQPPPAFEYKFESDV
ncbi:proteasome regulatory particle base subunit [Tulasnella sp. 330]|nr:proteasome regulatory particle base subunit [Tulasnella sp. 330]KAG8883674.1 proteasome regulatory particle base subunit [Tulasnella sp. 332]